MKNCKKMTKILLTAAALLTAVLMMGCTRLTPAESDTPSEPDTPAAAANGVYVKLERGNVGSVYLRGGSF